MSDQEGATLVLSRNFFYRDSYRKILFILLLSIVINILMTIVALYNILHPAPAQFIVTSADGRLIPVSPLSQPVKSTPQILAWANMAASRINSYDFVNFRSQLQDASSYFTAEGWRSYQRAFADTGNLNYVRTNKLVATAVATGAPVVLQQGLVSGMYTWKIQLPLLVKYQSATLSKNIPTIVTMLIQRTSIEENPSGIGIVYYRAST